MELTRARAIAERLKALLAAACERINMDGSDQPAIIIAGSTRRLKPDVGDIELLCIPKYIAGVDMLDAKIQTLIQLGTLDFRRNRLGSKVYGKKNKILVHVESGIGLDVFSTDAECWPVALVVRTGGKTTNQRIASAAIRKGWHLKAYGSGFSTPQGDVVCRSERDVFDFVDLRYLEPWERE